MLLKLFLTLLITLKPLMSGLSVAFLLSYSDVLLFSLEMTTSIKSKELSEFLEHLLPRIKNSSLEKVSVNSYASRLKEANRNGTKYIPTLTLLL